MTLKSLTEGFAKVNKKGKWGFIDLKGNPLTPFKYDNAWFFQNRYAKVGINNKYTYINMSGKEVTR